MARIQDNRKDYSVEDLCWVFGVPRSSFYRSLIKKKSRTKQIFSSSRKITDEEKTMVLSLLTMAENIDKSPRQVFYENLDNGLYICSKTSFYRILKENDACLERRRIRINSKIVRPELVATKPNQVWSWDVSKLKGPKKFQYFYLYTVIDIYSKLVVGWTVAESEKSEIAKDLFLETFKKHTIEPETLVVHSDRGSIMKSDRLQNVYDDLKITKSLNRPYVSNDNPFSEANFKTLKYRPDYPERFNSLHQADLYLTNFYKWYNNNHYHSGINMLKPHDVHYGKQTTTIQNRNNVMAIAKQKHPERFLGNSKKYTIFEEPVYINKPYEKVS